MEPLRQVEGRAIPFGAKNVERVGDHTTNIAETIHYWVTGVQLTAERPKGDNTNVSVELAD